MAEYIDKAAAIDALGEEPLVWHDDDDYTLGQRSEWIRHKEAIEALPSVTPKQPEPMMLHVNCDLSKEEYEKLMNDIGKQSVVLLPQEKEQQWILTSEKLPEDDYWTVALVYDTESGFLYEPRVLRYEKEKDDWFGYETK